MALAAQGMSHIGLLHRASAAQPAGRGAAAAQLPAGCRQRRHAVPPAVMASGSSGEFEEPIDLTASFAEELQRREASQAAATEAQSAYKFDGAALLQTILDR